MEKFKVVGMGPGGLDYIIPAALKAVRGAQVLVGAPRQIEAMGEEILNGGKDTFVYRSNLDELIGFLRNNRDRRIAVLVTGDPGYHSLLGVISRNFSPEEYEVIPGISSFQTAMARLGKPWQADRLCSCHGKDFQEIREAAMETLQAGHRVILLTDGKRRPPLIAAELLEAASGNRGVWLGEDLTLPEEEWTETSLEELSRQGDMELEKNDRLCVMIVQ